MLTSGIFSNVFNVFGDLSLQARGGLILGFGAAGASVQTLALHLFPGCLSGTRTWKIMLLLVVRSLICLSILYVLEILLIWAALGEHLFGNPLVQRLHHWIWWVIFSVPLGLHLVFLEIPHISRQEGLPAGIPVKAGSIRSEHATESDHLLPTLSVLKESTSAQPEGWWSQVRADLAEMQIPFELLMATCMTGLLIHCVGATGTLWPTSKALLLTNKPDWLIPLAVIALMFICVICVISIISSRRRIQVN
jgi:hypothetical protein